MVVHNHHHSVLNPSVVLLIPTVEGRDFLAETLASVRPHANCFDLLILSVNGISSRNAEALLKSQDFTPSLNTIILCTGRALTAMHHQRFINNALPAYTQDGDLIFLLADDDLLPAGSDIKDYVRAIRDRGLGSVGMGRFGTFGDNQPAPSLQAQHVEPGESISPLDFLDRNQQGHRFTNISSMIIPFGLFKEACSFMWRMRSAGRRAEYIFATHSSAHSLYSPYFCSALIRQHAAQEGRTLSFESYLHDELVYILWVWLHQPAMRPWSRAVGQDFTFRRFRSFLRDLLKRKLSRKVRQCLAMVKACLPRQLCICKTLLISK